MFSYAAAIGSIPVNPALVLAPMSGFTSSAFRRFIKRHNPGAVGLVVSELVSVEGLLRGGRRTLELMRFREEERPVALQIFGYEVESMRRAAILVEQAGADIVDINCGCPVPKVVKKGGGCQLMRQPEHLKEILRAVRKAVQIPLTVKIRAGWNENVKNALEVARLAEGEGIDGLSIHGRTKAQLYSGECDWELISQVAQSVSIPVFGSGDVSTPELARQRMKCGIAGLYVGRTVLSRPLIFSEIVRGEADAWKKDEPLLVSLILDLLETLREDFPPNACAGRLKKVAARMCRGRPWSRELCLAKGLEEQLQILARAQELAQSKANGDT